MDSPRLRTYKAGSIIYFIEDKGHEIYILQKGRVLLISNALDSNAEIKEEVKKGEFFGVKSALGAYPREETVQVLTDTVVLVFTPQLFENFCLKNSRIVLQMLKVFSGQLRKVHRKVREALGDTGDAENSVDLLKTAEYYYKSAQVENARYAYRTFMKHYSSSSYATRANQLMQMLNNGQPYPVEIETIEQYVENLNAGNQPFSAPQADNSFGSPADAPPDLDSFDHDPVGMQINDNDLPDLPSDDPPPAAAGAGGSDISQTFYAALNDFSQGNIDGAIEKYQAVLQQTNFANQGEAQFLEKALYELGRSFQKKGAIDTAIEKYSEFVKKYPRSQFVKKGILGVAECYEKKNDRQRAIGLYNKVVAMPPKDKDNIIARQKLERLMR